MHSTRGAVAAGHPLTAEAAMRMYRLGGNAFDAVLAAMAAACVVEPVLTSLGGGGFLLARQLHEKPLLFDFFVQTPLRRRDATETEFYPIVADFGTAQQEFHIGAGSIATPGTIRGLVDIHARLGSMPLREILAPAIEYASTGVAVNALQAYIFSIVAPIYRATPNARSLYAPEALGGEGCIFHQPALAEAFRQIAEEGADPFYLGEMAQRLVTLCETAGGHLTRDDLASYRMVVRAPAQHRYRGYTVNTNPPPSSGGVLINFALTALDGQQLGSRFGAATHATTLLKVMEYTNTARGHGMLERSVKHRRMMEDYLAAVKGHPVNSRGTTHISTVDADGNSASMTLSNGEGCGHLLPDTGIMLNNMLGEEDLNPEGFNRWPLDVRVSSMMAPTLAEDRHRLIAIGSGGSNRLRTAILQTLINLIDFAMSPEQAVNAPRMHFERDRVDIEPGFDETTLALIRERYPEHCIWNAHNLFFGGTHTVCWDGKQFSGAGDPRRGGVFLRSD